MRKLKALRQMVGESLAVAGAEINKAPSTVLRWESGEQTPSDYSEVRKLALFFLDGAERRADEARKLVKELL